MNAIKLYLWNLKQLNHIMCVKNSNLLTDSGAGRETIYYNFCRWQFILTHYYVTFLELGCRTEPSWLPATKLKAKIVRPLYPTEAGKFLPGKCCKSSLFLPWQWEKIPIKITVLAQHSCSIFIFLFILYCRIVEIMLYHIWTKFTKQSIKFHTQYHIFYYSTI